MLSLQIVGIDEIFQRQEVNRLPPFRTVSETNLIEFVYHPLLFADEFLVLCAIDLVVHEIMLGGNAASEMVS